MRTPEQIVARSFVTRRDTIKRKLFEFTQLTGSEMAVFGRHNGEVYSFGTEEFLDSLGVQVNTRLPNDLPNNPSTATSSLNSTTSELQAEPFVGSTPDSSPLSNSPTPTPHTPSTSRRSSSHPPRSLPLTGRIRRRGSSTTPARRSISRRTVSPTPLKRLSQCALKSLKTIVFLD